MLFPSPALLKGKNIILCFSAKRYEDNCTPGIAFVDDGEEGIGVRESTL